MLPPPRCSDATGRKNPVGPRDPSEKFLPSVAARKPRRRSRSRFLRGTLAAPHASCPENEDGSKYWDPAIGTRFRDCGSKLRDALSGPRAVVLYLSVGERGRIEVQAEKQTVKDAPSYSDNEEITPELERRVYEHYGLTYAEAERGAYGDDYESEAATTGTGRTGSTEDELRVGRTEEELRAGTREREAGSVRVRKRVRTDREQVRVPKRREEVSVERVPVEGEASKGEIGEDEVRKEEIDVDDESERRNR